MVVVADDEPHLVALVASLLEPLGVAVVTAADGEQALQAVQTHRPRLLITDVMMPKLRGDVLCRQLKARPETAAIKVLLTSAMEGARLEHADADAYVPKPFDLDTLERSITHLLGGHGGPTGHYPQPP